MKAWIPLSLGLVLLAVQTSSAGKPSQSQPAKGAAMDSTAKPFGLSQLDQAKAKIIFAWHSPKTGARKQSIEIDGTGAIRTVRSTNPNGPDEILSGKVKAAEVTALLVLLEGEDIPGYDSEYSVKADHEMVRQISLTLPNDKRTVYAAPGNPFPQFEHIAGAIEYLAAEGKRHTALPAPFGLKSSDLKGVRIFLSNSVKKTGYGKEQLEMEGTGDVKISHSANYQAPLKSLTGKVSQEQVLVLLSYLEMNGFVEMKEQYTANTMYEPVRHVSLTLPGKEIGVYAEDPSAPTEFIRIYGAVKFLAGIAVPECLDRKKYFFFYL